MADQIALEFVPLVDQFLARVRQLAEEAQQALLPLEQGEQLRLDVSQAEAELSALREQLLAFGETPVSVRFDPAQAEAALGVLQERLAALQEVAQVVVDPTPAVAGLEEIATAAGEVAAGLGAVGAAAQEMAPVVAEAAVAAEPGLVNIAGAAYKAALAVDSFARQAAVASEVTPSLNLAAGRAAVAIEELEAAMRQAATTGGPVSAQQIATLQALVAILQAAQVQVSALTGAQQQLAGAAGAAAGSTTAAGTAAAGAGAAAAGATAGVGALERAMNLLVSTTAFYLGMRIARFFGELVSGSLDAEEALGRITTALDRSRGAGAGASGELDLLRRTADGLGLPLKETAEHYSKFTETLKGSEVPVRTQQNLLLGVATALAATRQPAESAGQAFELFSRLAARDETQFRQLASALNNIIPGSMRIAAAALFEGENSLARFEAAAKKGQVSSQDFLNVIGPAYIREFQGQLPGAVDSTTASLNRLKNAEFEAQVGIGEGFSSAVRQATGEFRAFLDTAGDTPRAFGEVVAAFVWLGTKTGELVGTTVKGAGALVTASVALIYEAFTRVAGALRSLSEMAHLTSVTEGLRAVETEWRFMTDSLVEEADRAQQQSDALAAALLGLTEPAHRGALGISEITARGKDFAGGINEQIAGIDRQVEAIQKQADALGRVGPVAREAADDLVKSIDKELKAISELPVAERRSLADRAAILDQLRSRYEQFTTAYIRLQDQQGKAAESLEKREAKALEKREKAVADFFRKIQADEDNAQKQRAKSSQDLQKRIESDTSQISGIEGGSFVSPDDLNKLDTLKKDLRDAQDEAKKLADAERSAGVAAAALGTDAQQAGQKMRQGFQAALAEDEALRSAVAALGPASRTSFAAVLDGLVQLKSEGRATQTEIDAAGRQIAQIFTAAGVASAGFAERLGLVSHSADSLRTSILGLPPATAAAAAGSQQLAAATTAAGQAATAAGQAHHFNAESAKESAAAAGTLAAAESRGSEISITRAKATSGLNDELRIKTTLEPQLAGAIDQVTTSEQKAAEAQSGATAGTIEFRGHVVELSKATADAASPSGGVMRMGDRVVEVGKAASAAAPKADQLAESATKTATAMDRTATSTDHAASSLTSAAGHLVDFKAAADGTGEAAHTVGAAFDGIAASGAHLPAVLQPIVILLGQLVSLKADEALQRADDAMASLGPDTRTAGEGVKAFLAEVKKDLETLKQFAVALKDADTWAKALAVDLREDVRLCKELKECTAALAAS
jgi:hypothetical protein